MRNRASIAVGHLLHVGVTLVFVGVALGQGGTFGGRVVAGVETPDIIVSIRAQNDRLIAQTMTDSRGSFRFADQSLIGQIGNQYLYLVVEHEGFLPYRQRLDPSDMRGGVLMVYLEPEGGDGTTDDGAVSVRQLLANIPPEAVRERERAREDAADGDHDRARERLEHAVALAPDYYAAWLDLGSQYVELGRLEDARDAYVEASAVDPNGALAQVNLGVLSYQEGERLVLAGQADAAVPAFGDAEGSLRRALEIDPQSVSGHFYLGATFYRTGRYLEAETELLRAIDLAGEYPNASLMLINVYARAGAYDLALEQAEAFLAENPDAPERESIERVRTQLREALGL